MPDSLAAGGKLKGKFPVEIYPIQRTIEVAFSSLLSVLMKDLLKLGMKYASTLFVQSPVLVSRSSANYIFFVSQSAVNGMACGNTTSMYASERIGSVPWS